MSRMARFPLQLYKASRGCRGGSLPLHGVKDVEEGTFPLQGDEDVEKAQISSRFYQVDEVIREVGLRMLDFRYKGLRQ